MSERLPELPPDAFRRIDEDDDLDFYAPPRLVTHIDEGATAALSAFTPPPCRPTASFSI